MMDQIAQDAKILCDACGVTSRREITQALYTLLEPLTDDVSTDNMGNVLAVRRGRAGAPRVMLQAHLDEIGFLVTSVDEKGFLRVAAAGGVDRRVLAAQRVTVYGDEPYHGVFCSVPPHLAGDKKELPELRDMGVDVGMSHDEAAQKIPVGSRVSFAADFHRLNDRVVSSKALDDRAGIAAILHCLRSTPKDSAEIWAALCVQEELGSRGAAVAARRIQPDFALVTDVSFAETPDADPRACGKMAGGAMIGVSPILDAGITADLQRLAERCGIPYQNEVMGGRTGTDADVISCENCGIPTGLLSIPQRYMHTPVECVDLRDIAAVGDLMTRLIVKRGAENE